MTTLYSNLTLYGPSQRQLVNCLRQAHRNTYVSPTLNNFTTVYDEECEGQNELLLAAMASDLTKFFQCPGLIVLNHNNEVFWYQLYDCGNLMDEYNSWPDYFYAYEEDVGEDGEEEIEPDLPVPIGGKADKLCQLFCTESNIDRVEIILRAEFDCAANRHKALAKALGLPQFSVGFGYRKITAGEPPASIELKDLKFTGNKKS